MPEYKNKSKDDKKNNAGFPYLVLAASIFITIVVSYNFHRNAFRTDRARFDEDIAQIHSLVETKTNLYIALFGSLGAEKIFSDLQKNTLSDRIAVKFYERENLPARALAASEENLIDEERGNFGAIREIDVGGKKWTAEYKSLPSFAEQSAAGWTPLIFFTGIVFSFLLTGIIYWQSSARAALRKTAAEMFELQKRKQILYENEQAARRAAELANKTKDEFIAVVSHELRTPLNAIGGWTNILRMDNLPTATKKLALEKIEKNLRSQIDLVEELLEYSQIISGTANFNKKQISFSEVFENTYSKFLPKAFEKDIEFVRDNRLNGQNIFGDGEKIEVVINNLFSNAVKFTHRGGKINVTVSENDGFVQMSVKDNGKGINPEFLPFVFERFRQADASITRNFGGLGLGLAISNHIVRIHHGTIEATSEGKEKGTVFTLKLPLLSCNL
ncbi:MAG: HAMP domain-containing histidine kinase [Acidobacteriota bacterium]|nr:HAMP domain-containing histidine kinase [Acidobacteriota bacterium]